MGSVGCPNDVACFASHATWIASAETSYLHGTVYELLCARFLESRELAVSSAGRYRSVSVVDILLHT